VNIETDLQNRTNANTYQKLLIRLIVGLAPAQ